MSYSLFQDVEYFNRCVLRQGYRVIVFDETRGFEQAYGRVRTHLNHLRAEGAFVLGLNGTPFSTNLDGAVSMLWSIGATPGRSWDSVRDAMASHVLRREAPQHWSVHRDVVALQLQPRQRKQYEALTSRFGVARLYMAFPELVGLVRLAPLPTRAVSLTALIEGSAKLAHLVVWASGVFSSHPAAKIVVFVSGSTSLEIVRACLALAVDFVPPSIDATAGATYSQQLTLWFNEEAGQPRILLCTQRAGGRGLNLPAASHMIFFDVPSTGRIAEQCIHRALRQPRHVATPLQVTFTYVADTIEEGRWLTLWLREALAAELLGSRAGGGLLGSRRSGAR